MDKWFAQAPANIALIKYMGKDDETINSPSTPSFSYTLDNLLSFVEIESIHGTKDSWEALTIPGSQPFHFTAEGQSRFLKHLAFLKEHFKYEGAFVVRSCNNFPIAAGLASSASSFAALTKAAVRALTELTHCDEPNEEAQALLSQRGSGSSCRSFFTPWAYWDKTTVKAITDIPFPKLIHHAIIVDHAPKKVLSSEAHRHVKTSPLFADRKKNTPARYQALHTALLEKNWQEAYRLTREDFLEMHQLFETATQPFRYMTDQSKQILNDIERLWQNDNDGPLVTMDAGPNVHLLFRADQSKLAETLKEKFLYDYDVI